MHLVLAAVALAVSASTDTISQNLSQKAHISLAATSSGCENNPGPFITLNGEMTLSGVSARIILTNNRKFTHVTSADVTADVVLIPAGEQIKIAKQPSQGGVGGNPWIYLSFNDGKKDLGAPQLLGRCVQGLGKADLDFTMPTGAKGKVTSGGCDNAGGPTISLNGELKMGGLNGQLIFTNNAKFTHAAAGDVVVDLVLLPEGRSILFAKQPPLGGAGGNPLIYIQFLDGSGNALSSPLLMGRCNKL